MVGHGFWPRMLNISNHRVIAAMKILDPNLKDGIHEWRDGKRFVKEGAKLYLEGTDTLAGRYVSRIACVVHADRWTTPQRYLSGHLRPQLLALHGVFLR
jgi:hypothetical protein